MNPQVIKLIVFTFLYILVEIGAPVFRSFFLVPVVPRYYELPLISMWQGGNNLLWVHDLKWFSWLKMSSCDFHDSKWVQIKGESADLHHSKLKINHVNSTESLKIIMNHLNSSRVTRTHDRSFELNRITQNHHESFELIQSHWNSW
jgi:hypothetical protein